MPSMPSTDRSKNQVFPVIIGVLALCLVGVLAALVVRDPIPLIKGAPTHPKSVELVPDKNSSGFDNISWDNDTAFVRSVPTIDPFMRTIMVPFTRELIEYIEYGEGALLNGLKINRYAETAAKELYLVNQLRLQAAPLSGETPAQHTLRIWQARAIANSSEWYRYSQRGDCVNTVKSVRAFLISTFYARPETKTPEERFKSFSISREDLEASIKGKCYHEYEEPKDGH